MSKTEKLFFWQPFFKKPLLFEKFYAIIVAFATLRQNMEAYRSGHNGTDSKSVVPHGTVGSNPTASANKNRTFVYQKFYFCLSKPQAWYIIAAQRAVYIISPLGAVSHHAPACIFLRLDDIPQQVADDIQGYALIYSRMCDII